MDANDDKLHLLKLHPCAWGLSDEALREIAESAELVRCQPGEVVHRSGATVTAIYLIIHGRVKVSLLDVNGRVLVERHQRSGSQFGGVAAALAEPSPVECVAEDPSTLLKLDYLKSLEIAKRYDQFRVNFAHMMAETVRRSLYNDRLPSPPNHVGFMHESGETRIVSQKLFERLANFGEQIGVFTDQPVREKFDGLRELRVVGGDRDLTPAEVRSQASEWLMSGRLFTDVATSIDPTRAASALEKSELVLWCVTPKNWQASVPRLKSMLANTSGWRDKVRVLWLLEPGEQAPLASELRDLCRRDLKVAFGSPGPQQGKVLFDGFERLVHLVRGIQVGVALGGGAARGMAHLGVLKALEQGGITIDMIAGTSAGAMTGTPYAAGMSPDHMINSFKEDLRPSRLFRSLPRGDQWYLLYKYRMGRFDPMLRKYLGDARIEQLPLPMHTVTVDLIQGQPVVRSAGDAVHGILESINLPVLAKPINRSGQALVDGGLINNIPADVLVSLGCNFVIAVSVTAKMEREFARNRPDTPDYQMRPASVIQTILRTFLVQSSNINAIGVQPADFVIEPDVTGFQLTEFTRADELAAIGERTTQAAIPKLRQMLNRLDPQLFPATEGGTPLLS